MAAVVIQQLLNVVHERAELFRFLLPLGLDLLLKLLAQRLLHGLEVECVIIRPCLGYHGQYRLDHGLQTD